MIIEFENNLRRIICSVLGDHDDVDFGVTPERIATWKEKREIEQKKKKGILLETRIIYYSDFYDLYKIIDKNWTSFKPIFIDKKRFEIFFNEVENCRNTIAHGREILSFQNDLLKGIIGDLKNQIINYHSNNMNPDDVFVKILKISDSLGNIWESSDITKIYSSKKVLKVGDKLEFIIEAFDPNGREIEYFIEINYDNTIKQKNNRIILEITKKMISRSKSFTIGACTMNEDYKNRDSVIFCCTIMP